MTEEAQEIDAADIEQDDIADAEPVVQEEPAEPTEPTTPEWSAEDEEEARLFGWKSPDEWQGDKPAGYIGKPDEFLDRVQRSRIFKAMQDKLQTTEQQAAELARKQEAMNQRAIERQREQHAAELQRITTAQRRAVEEADPEAYDQLEAQRQKLQAPPEAIKQDTPPTNPDVEAYRASETGAWLNNPVLAKTAAELVGQNPAILVRSAKEQIAYAEAEIRKMYPAYFPKPEPKPAPRTAVDGGGLATGGGSKPVGAFTKLPSEAKANFARFVKEGLYSDTKEDREEYANEYAKA